MSGCPCPRASTGFSGFARNVVSAQNARNIPSSDMPLMPNARVPRAMSLRAGRKAALLYLVAAAAMLGILGTLLFSGESHTSTPSAILLFVFVEGPDPHWFRWLAMLPVLCLALSASYLSRRLSSRFGAVWLLAAGTLLSVAAWFTVTPELALFVTLPLSYGFVHVKESMSRP